jgi:hypothetical protein
VTPLVLGVCGDAGGAAAVAPVAALLRAEGRVRVRVLASPQAAPAFAALDLATEECVAAPSLEEAASMLRADRPAVLLAGSTYGPVEPEKPMILASRVVGVPSLVVLDFWSNYRPRFSDASGDLTYLPDRIAVMDERARSEMVAEGFSADRLLVVGTPVFDTLQETRAAFTPSDRRARRAQLGAAADDRVVLFVSQPLAEVYGDSLGYTEHIVLPALTRALDALAERHDLRIVLSVRPHPREEPSALALPATRRVRLARAEGASGRAWALTADLVVGMNSMLLLEACYLGCIVLSFQPGLQQPDLLPTNRDGLSLPVYTPQETAPALERALCDAEFRAQQAARLSRLAPPTGATRRLADLVYTLGHVRPRGAVA